MNIEKLAGIDIGSNAIRLLVSNAIIERKGRKVSFKKSALVRVPIRLGADSFLTGKISNENSDRMIKAMKAFKLLMEVHGVSKFYACATSAMREAENGEAIIKKIEEESSIKINIIDGKKEADIIFSTDFAGKERSVDFNP